MGRDSKAQGHAGLSVRERRAVFLHNAGAAVCEIARFFGVSRKAIYSRIERARAKRPELVIERRASRFGRQSLSQFSI